MLRLALSFLFFLFLQTNAYSKLIEIIYEDEIPSLVLKKNSHRNNISNNFVNNFLRETSDWMWFGWDELVNRQRYAGVGLYQAYQDFPLKVNNKTIIVAIIDSGIDIYHPLLEGKIWKNTKEIPGNGIDDDGNGYIDDVNGWNFLGDQVIDDFSGTRVLRQLLNKSFSELTDNEQKNLQSLKDLITPRYQEAFEELKETKNFQSNIIQAWNSLKPYGLEELSFNHLAIVDQVLTSTQRENFKEHLELIQNFLANRLTLESLEAKIKRLEQDVKVTYNYFKDSYIETLGDANVIGADPTHGTTVAGIFAQIAEPFWTHPNALAPQEKVLIMPIRAIPSIGDERDHNVAKAIRYAVDNGAHIINLSFSKRWSENESHVKMAIEYALEKNIIIVKAAGNERENNDKIPNYPTPFNSVGEKYSHFFVVGSSAPLIERALVSRFSNYGQNSVDFLAPGERVLSLGLNGQKQITSGTSIASPIVARLFSLYLSHFDHNTDSLGENFYQGVSLAPENEFIPRNHIGIKEATRSQGIINIWRTLKITSP